MRPRAVGLVVVLFSCWMLSSAGSANAQSSAQQQREPDSTLSIIGTGTAEAVPDRATLNVRVRSGASTATTARSRVNARVRAILAGIQGLGVPRGQIQTSSISLSRTTRKPLRRGGPRRVFFTASGSIVITTGMIGKVGAIVDSATKNGADEINGPSFTFSSASAGKLEATRVAIDDARRRAQDAAARLGQRITGTRSIVIDPGGGSSDDSFEQESDSAPASGAPAPRPPTPVRPGRETTRASVAIVFLLAPA